MIKPSGTVTAWRALTRMGLGLLGGLLLLPQLTLAALPVERTPGNG